MKFNPHFLIIPGNIQRTMKTDFSVIVEAEFEEIFPEEFGISDLGIFVGSVLALGEPDLAFSPEFVTIGDGRSQLQFRAKDKRGLIKPSSKGVDPEKLGKVDFSFSLSESTMKKIIDIATLNELESLTLVNSGGKFRIKSSSSGNNNKISNVFTVDMPKVEAQDFNILFRTENLSACLTDDYEISVTENGQSVFQNKNKKIKYYIAPEP